MTIELLKKKHSLKPRNLYPEFEENSGGMLVTLFCSEPKKDIRGKQPELQQELQPESLKIRVLGLFAKGELSKSEISIQLRQKKISR